MQQVYLYYKGSANTPANRDITELFLMEEFHWTPKQISEIPYKNIQKIILIKNQKYETQRINENIARSRSSSTGAGRGGSFTREI
jgi:hypothetical protein